MLFRSLFLSLSLSLSLSDFKFWEGRAHIYLITASPLSEDGSEHPSKRLKGESTSPPWGRRSGGEAEEEEMLGAGMGGGAESRQVSGSRQTDSWMPRAPGTKVALHLGERLPVFPPEKSDRVSSTFSHLP